MTGDTMPRFHVARRTLALFATAAVLAAQFGVAAQAADNWPNKPR